MDSYLGRRFGKLSAKEFVGYGEQKKPVRMYLCICDCGNERVVQANHLRTGATSHCGCQKFLPKSGKDLTGKTFGRWEVLSYVGRSRYLCRCECGTEKEICSRELKNGDSRSCGCLMRELATQNLKDLTGKVFGRLQVIERAGSNNWRNAVWKCLCSCGNETEVPSGLLKKGHTTSCGCAFVEMVKSVPHEEKVRRHRKAIKSIHRNATDFRHWKTGEVIKAIGSYEKAVIEWLQREKIDYAWQIPFKMKTGKTYIIDLYIKDLDIYVEIKGRMYPTGKEKWEEFHNTYSNSELWDRNVLKQRRIL